MLGRTSHGSEATLAVTTNVYTTPVATEPANVGKRLRPGRLLLAAVEKTGEGERRDKTMEARLWEEA